MVPGKFPVPGRPTILITIRQGHTALPVGAGGVVLYIFTLIYPLSFLLFFSLSLGDGPIKTEILPPKSINQPTILIPDIYVGLRSRVGP